MDHHECHVMSALELLDQTHPAPCSQCAIKSAQAYAKFMTSSRVLSRATIKARQDLHRRKAAGKWVDQAREQYIARCYRARSVSLAAHTLADAVVVEMDTRVALAESKCLLKIAQAETAKASQDYQIAKDVEIRCYRLALELSGDS